MSIPSGFSCAHTFLVDSIIGACRTDSFYPSSNMYMPAASEMGTYGMQTCGLLPSFGKRVEVGHQNVGMNVHSYVPQIENWADPNDVSAEPPSQNQTVLLQSIKEEITAACYSDKSVSKKQLCKEAQSPTAPTQSLLHKDVPTQDTVPVVFQI
ncbi:unnamed protein product [Knipowitschia caucasica]